jgi:hypothetical protein
MHPTRYALDLGAECCCSAGANKS